MTYNKDRNGFDVTIKVGTEYIAGIITCVARGYYGVRYFEGIMADFGSRNSC